MFSSERCLCLYGFERVCVCIGSEWCVSVLIPDVFIPVGSELCVCPCVESGAASPPMVGSEGCVSPVVLRGVCMC